MRIRLTILFALALCACTGPRAGKPLPQWSEGCLDIHFINNGRGEGYFCIFPDGTTMLVDAGDTRGAGGAYKAMPPRRPDTLTAGPDVYADYIRHFLPATRGERLDYILLSHFHGDHYGDVRLATSEENGYRHFCLAAVYDKVGADKLLDRGWPDYDNTVKNTSASIGDYAAFARFAQLSGTDVDRFELGRTDQIEMRKGGMGKYDFTVTNIAVNAATFTAQGDTLSTPFDSENAGSCAFHMNYGKFDFIACGDLTGTPQDLWAEGWYDSFRPSVEVFKANHHLHHNAWGSGMQKVGFKSKTIFGFCFGKTDQKHVTTKVLETAADAGDLFITNAYEGSIAEFPGVYARLKDYNGHFVVRVKPGGDEFSVYKLSDTDSSFKVLAAYGPYYCE